MRSRAYGRSNRFAFSPKMSVRMPAVRGIILFCQVYGYMLLLLRIDIRHRVKTTVSYSMVKGKVWGEAINLNHELMTEYKRGERFRFSEDFQGVSSLSINFI